jgi:hypothetical protein
MAHSKCLSCRARVWREGSSPEDLCPGCGGPLLAVGDLAELVGLRSLRARPRGRRHSLPERSDEVAGSISQQIRQQIARNDAERQRRIDA